MDNLPNELLIMILNHMNIHDLQKIRYVNTILYNCIDDPRFYLNLCKPGVSLNVTGFDYFYLWYHKYIIYRTENVDITTIYKTYEYLDQLSKLNITLVLYIQRITEALIAYGVCDTDTFWALVYGYITMHQRRVGGDRKLLDAFKARFYRGSEIIVKYSNV